MATTGGRVGSDDPLRVTLVISSLSLGGAERVMSIMANYWADRGWPITLITFDVAENDFYTLHSRVQRVPLGLSRASSTPLEALRNNARRIGHLRAAIRASRPEVVISFMAPMTMLTLIATRGERIPVVVSDRTDPTQHRLSRFWSLVRRLVYARASAVVVQTPEVRRWAEQVVPARIVHSIPNPVVPPAALPANHDGLVADLTAPNRTTRQIAAMGRLHSEKGFDRLLHAFARADGAREGWQLVILGEGAERAALESLAQQLGIAANVSLMGRVREPSSVLRRSDLFVLSSRYEGFPNALLEAMAAGLPVIAADCPSGPRHIIRHGVDGLLVPPDDTNALAGAIRYLLGDDEARQALAERASEVIDRFGVGHVMAQWEQLARSCIATTTASLKS